MSNVEKILPHIATIHDLDESIDTPSRSESPVVLLLAGWTIRMAARCIVVDPTSKRIALQGLDTEGVIKIPGGGLQYEDAGDNDEGFRNGIVREIAEETGIDASSMKLETLGVVTEYRKKWKLQQVSFCYVGTVSETEEYGEPLEEGSRLVWADTPAHAIDLVASNDTDTYDKAFLRMRDLAILEYYRSVSTAI